MLRFAAGLERGAVSAYLGAVPLFANRELAKAAASILGDEAMHWAVLRNAVDATRTANAPQIDLVMTQGDTVILTIRDNGSGIADIDKVFEPFFSTKEEGTGLGLPIARRIFEEHGGWLHLHSAQGKGATFVIVLPARKDDSWLRS